MCKCPFDVFKKKALTIKSCLFWFKWDLNVVTVLRKRVCVCYLSGFTGVLDQGFERKGEVEDSLLLGKLVDQSKGHCQPFLSDKGLVDLSCWTKASPRDSSKKDALVEGRFMDKPESIPRDKCSTSWTKMPLLRGDASTSLNQSQGTNVKLVGERCPCRGELHGQARINPKGQMFN